MRFNMLTRLLMLALVLTSLCAAAQAEGCALCGEETGNDNYLCVECMLGLLEEKDVSGGMEIIGAAPNEDGSVTLVWDDEAANGPYTVYYELLDCAPVPFGWTAASNVYGNVCTLTQLVPGMSYVFTVEDAAGNKADFIYYAPNVRMGNEVGARLMVETRMVCNGTRVRRPLNVGDIRRLADRESGLYMVLSYSMLKYTRQYAYTITVEAPNGYADVVSSGQITLNYGRSEVPAWGFLPLDHYFSYLDRYYGGVIPGEYIVTLNFNGVPACADTFVVDP